MACAEERVHYLESAGNEEVLRAQNEQLKDAELQSRDEIAALEQKCELLNGRIQELTESNKRAVEEMLKLKQHDASRLEKIARLESQLRASASAGSAVSEWETRCRDIETQYGALLEGHATLRAETEAIRGEKQKVVNKCLRAEMDRDEYKTEVARIRKQVSALQADLRRVEESANLLSESKRGLELEVLQLQSERRAWQSSNPADKDRHVAALTDQVRVLDEARAVHAHEIGVLHGRLRVMGLQVDEVNEELAAEQRRAAAALSELHTSRALLGSYEDELTRLRNVQPELQGLRDDNRELNDRILAMTQRIEDLQEKLHAAAADRSESDRIDELEAELATVKLSAGMAEERAAQELRDVKDRHARDIEALTRGHQDAFALQQELNMTVNKMKLMEAEFAREKENMTSEFRKKTASQLAELQKEVSLLSQQLSDTRKQNAELNALLDKPHASQLEVKRMKEREQELRLVISKLIKAEESTEGAFTCLSCMNIYRKPVTCIPCGHSFCMGCIQAAGHCTVRTLVPFNPLALWSHQSF
jgi:chromosome segregation ATPase